MLMLSITLCAFCLHGTHCTIMTDWALGEGAKQAAQYLIRKLGSNMSVLEGFGAFCRGVT